MKTFYLDPDNVGFIPGQSELKTRLVHNDQISAFEGCLYVGSCLPMALIIIAMLSIVVFGAVGYLVQGTNSEATLESCRHEPPKGKSSGSIVVSYSYKASGHNMLKAEEKIVNNYIDCETVPVGGRIQIQYVTGSSLLNSQVTDPRLIAPIADRVFPYLALFGLLIFCGITVFLGSRSLFRYLRARRWLPALQNGTVLNGTLVECTGSREGRHPSAYTVRVRYRFQSPYGRELSGRQVYRRDELRFHTLPEPGIPVKILYASDNCYIML